MPPKELGVKYREVWNSETVQYKTPYLGIDRHSKYSKMLTATESKWKVCENLLGYLLNFPVSLRIFMIEYWKILKRLFQVQK